MHKQQFKIIVSIVTHSDSGPFNEIIENKISCTFTSTPWPQKITRMANNDTAQTDVDHVPDIAPC
jgi:hypothetical protein